MSTPLTPTARLQEERDYWVRQLSRELGQSGLPLDGQRSAVFSPRRESVPFALEGELYGRLSKLSGGSPMLFYTTVMAALAICLHRYNDSETIVVGSPAYVDGGAPPPNVLAVVAEVSDQKTFKQLLVDLRATMADAYARQGCPFDLVVKDLGLAQAHNRCPLFDVVLVLEGFHGELPELKNDVSVFLSASPGGAGGRVEFNARLFRKETVERFAAHLVNLLREALADLDAPVHRLDMLSPAERHQLLEGGSETRADYPALCVHHLFDAQAERTPDAVALTFGERHMTYAELQGWSNRLARHLRKMSVGPDVLVGVCVGRSIEMAVGVLGILKAGGAYVALDPAYPQERLSFMLEDTKVPVLLTLRGLAGALPPHAARTVYLDEGLEEIEGESAEPFDGGASPDNLAYVLYTSGSTGVPKGVNMTHRPLSGLAQWHRQDSTLAPGATVLQFASLNFDVSFQELFTTWCSGGRVVLIDEELRRDISLLPRFLEENGVERIFLTFVAFQQLAQMCGRQKFYPSHLKEIIPSGDQLQINETIIEFLRQLGHNCLVQNQYGPSETHCVTYFSLRGSPTRWPALPPLGYTLAGARIYLLDRHGQPVPLGVAGEIYIGGASLSRGYLRRPALTAERFVPDPFALIPGARMYKTGDLARFLPGGEIEFLGRVDQQVKIRGYRIEPGEVEAALRGVEGVREAAVVAREDVAGDKRLVAYVVVQEKGGPTAEELRGRLAGKLPEYMIPSFFVYLDEMPLTPNRKVNRRALPAPDQGRNEQEESFVGPRNPLEETLAGIWTEVLGVERVSVNDNFFQLGGHSLLATQLISRVRESLQTELPLRALFETPTVASLAVNIMEKQAGDDGPQLSALLAEIEQLSDDEAKASLVAEEQARGGEIR